MDDNDKPDKKVCRAYPHGKGPQTGGPGARGAQSVRRRPMREAGSLARDYTKAAVRTLAYIMADQTAPAMSRVTAAKVMLDRGWGKCSETHRIAVNGETKLLKVINEIVHVHETREQIEFNDQTPLLELTPEDTPGDGSKKTH